MFQGVSARDGGWNKARSRAREVRRRSVGYTGSVVKESSAGLLCSTWYEIRDLDLEERRE